MNSESKINVHYSSLVGLKAELLRKQAEVAAVKAKLGNARPIINPTKTKTKNSDDKRKKPKLEEDEKADQPDNIKALEKSKLMLKAKSRLYEKLSKIHTNMNPNFLVDFENKSDGSDLEERKEDNDYDSDDGWVEYTDCFGRTRKCLREDLPKMQQKDDTVRKEIVEKPDEKVNEKVLFVEDRVPEKETEIEKLRRKWEEQTEKLAGKADIHYQDVLFDEARSHGVGYYAFSQDEEERIKQQENLLKLRKETEEKQKENQRIRDVKENIQQNRLKVARMRQRIRAGLPPEETEEEKATNSSEISSKAESNENQEIRLDNEIEKEEEESTESANLDLSNKREAAKRKLAVIENKIQVYEKILGKSNKWYVMSQEEWVHKKRQERDQEFAPVYQNFKHSGYLDSNESANNWICNENLTNSSSITNDNDDSNIIGPMPLSMDDSDIIGPVFPPMKKETVTPSFKGSTSNTNKNIADEVEAGLKYLRQQFENKHA